ncbi:flagellar biosynthesis regulatory protein FlaF [Hyphomicrobium nitrativorans NL23]|uniref:Flagellar biosynthesis regulatory protein FlaF n=1 Tax=Hyphomicrobium nitrativorans NL23 TaxID=1029756 RepID=V5SB72_9HYPH|nr:flagellar biosynthesis regulator FlaF [Hyphomicrobium nitrativorans]AHB47747.1 flagellar biosynthesis regulatory protein FlaF [Hyphomicrobium nitrativorans NL23]
MYKIAYNEVLDESPREGRLQERTALERSIAMLQDAERAGAGSREAIDAIFFVRKLWGIFIEDLASSENGLPQKLRADLISVGLWVMRESEEIRLGRSSNFAGLIDVSRTISEGLQ